MKMGKKRNIGISLMAVVAMMLAMPNVIHAAPPTSTGTEANPAHATINKHLLMPEGTITPAGTATFKFTAKSVDGAPATPTNMPAIPDRSVNFTTADAGTTAAGVKKVMKETVNIVDGVVFPHAGEYIYTVKEENSGFTLTNNSDLSESMAYSTIEYQIQIIVANNAAGTAVYVQSISVNVLSGGVVGNKVNDNDDEEGTSFAFDNKFVRTHLNDPTNPGDTNDTNLRISKKVAGDGGNLSQYFDFKTTFTAPLLVTPSTPATYKAGIMEGGTLIDPTPNGISGAAADHSFTISQGTAFTFKLKHGQKLVLLDLPVGAKYEASETDSKGHTANITVKANGVAGSESATTNVPSTYIGEAANSALVRNDKVASTPTGILMNNLPYVILIAIAIAGLAAAAGRKRLES